MKERMRKTTQYLMPLGKDGKESNEYGIYPSFKLGDDKIHTDINLLAKKISTERVVCIDGYIGVFFESFRKQLSNALADIGCRLEWIDVSKALLPEEQIEKLVQPFMGESNSIFGTRATIELTDFFDADKLYNLKNLVHDNLVIYYGCGASLIKSGGSLIYIDLPKNELQFRARAGSVRNLASSKSFDMKKTYKLFYFIDWIVLNKHKKAILKDIDVIMDGQRDEVYPWMEGECFRNGLKQMGQSPFRARPWFEPGVWGGSWIKDKINGLNKDVPNYAWSFELITPENGIIFQSSDCLLEVSFDFIMFSEGKAVMGAHDYSKFGDEFPIRFDFLDTFDGGNLSVQCHPRPEYCIEHFGENITQEETYYILDRKNDATVYLGFQEDIESKKFEDTLWESYNTNTPIDITKFVQPHPAQKHDLFLIPPGTIHASGIDNLVLEISTTPYIFTFKMYDWVRPDLDGKPRPLNIAHGMKNLYFDRKGEKAKKELISRPFEFSAGDDWVGYELPTHEKHSYAVNRYHFNSDLSIETGGKCHVLSLVEGTSITVESENGMCELFQYAESFVVPAATKKYKVTNNSEIEAKLIVAFMK